MKSLLLFFYNRFALNALVSEDYLKAIKYFAKIKNFAPEQKGINYNLGLAYLGNKDFEKSEDELLTAINTEGGCPEFYKTLGDLFYLSGKQNLALENYKKLQELTDKDSVGMWLSARIIILESAKDMSEIHKANDSLEKGLMFMKRKLYSQAEQAFNEAITLDPSNYQGFNNYGVLQLRQFNNYYKAQEYFEKAVSLNPHPMYLGNLKRAQKLYSLQSVQH